MVSTSKLGQPAPDPDEALPEELENEQIIDLPPREALSIVDPGIFGLNNPLAAVRPLDRPPTGPDTEPTPEAGET